MDPNWTDMSAWNIGAGGAPGYPQGAPGYPQGTQGYPQGAPGYPQGAPAYPQGAPGYPQGAPGYPQGASGGFLAQNMQPAPNPNYSQGFGYAAPSQGYPAGAPGYQPGPAQQHPASGQGWGGSSGQGFGYGPTGGQAYGVGQSSSGVAGAKAGVALTDMYDPSLKPKQGFNAEDDCQRLRKAMKGLGTDEKTIIDIMGSRTSDQRVQIVTKFKTMYGKDLIKEFISELTGHFEQLVVALCHPLREFEARELRKAMEGFGTNEDTLIEILGSRSNAQIRELQGCYSKLFNGRNLEKDLMSETTGHFKRFLVSCVQANRDESQLVDRQAARQDAQALYSAGEKRLGTDESTFNMILCSKSFAYLRQVFHDYQDISKRSIEKALKSELSGDLLDSFMAVVQCVENKPRFFANQLHKAMKGAGTRDTKLIRIVVTRCEVDMNSIKREYQAAYGKPLIKDIQSDTSGDYEKLLCALVGQ